MPAILKILIQISISLFLFWGLYKLLIRKIAHFGMQRFYLNASLIMSFTIPLLTSAFVVVSPPEWLNLLPVATLDYSPSTGDSPSQAAMDSSFQPEWMTILLLVYLAGVLWRLTVLGLEAGTMRNLYLHGQIKKEESFSVVISARIKRPFSFFHLIFLNKEMPASARRHTVLHEYAHVKELHSLDNILFEVAKTLLWFHPCMYQLKHHLVEVHEFLADQYVVSQSVNRQAYAGFLLENATQSVHQLMPSLSNKLITKRILMLSKTTAPRLNYLFLLILIPVGLLGFGACSMFEKESTPVTEIQGFGFEEDSASAYKGRTIRSIQWNGNSAFSDEVLSEAFGIKPGEAFDNEAMAAQLAYHAEGMDVTSMYMDNGYLFFTINAVLGPVEDDMVDIIFNIFEGNVIQVGTVCVKSDQGLETSLMDFVDIRPGQLFSRSSIMASTQNLQMAAADMEVTVIPTPVPEEGLVNLEFLLAKKEVN